MPVLRTAAKRTLQIDTIIKHTFWNYAMRIEFLICEMVKVFVFLNKNQHRTRQSF